MAVVFHGSPLSFFCPKRCYSTRSDSNGAVIWSGAAVFATPDRRIALQYTANTFPDNSYTTGVDLITKISEKDPVCIMVFGGRNKEDALTKLYGVQGVSSTGYLYHMNAKHFYREDGLGEMECIAMDIPQEGFLKTKEVVDRRAEIDKYINQGLIKIEWAPSAELYIQAKRKAASNNTMLYAYTNKCLEFSAVALSSICPRRNKIPCAIL